MGRVTTFTDEAVEFGSYGIPQSTGSIKVHCGVYVRLSSMNDLLQLFLIRSSGEQKLD